MPMLANPIVNKINNAHIFYGEDGKVHVSKPSDKHPSCENKAKACGLIEKPSTKAKEKVRIGKNFKEKIAQITCASCKDIAIYAVICERERQWLNR